ncbi:MAG TPA: methyltransferase domain-containing protein [Burkholderiales bacterium]|nr:methyltransferase domain-containing protein [Burkholderiales bacterium]
MQERLADVLEKRGADGQQQAMRVAFLDAVPFPPDARVLDLGCGTGVLTRLLGRRPGVSSVIGVDPAPALLDRAREAAAGIPNTSFREGDSRSLPLDDATFHVVTCDSMLSHVPGPERALAEAFRVLRPGGCLAAFDGDYATATVALGDHDPLQVCVDAMMANSVTDRRIMRRLTSIAAAAGFEIVSLRSFGFVETSSDGYMLTVVDRGADILRSQGNIGEETADSLKAEARRRLKAGRFFGHIAYAGLVARKPVA